MNELIKELAEQAVGETQLMMIMEYKNFESKLYEKFAELILQHCFDSMHRVEQDIPNIWEVEHSIKADFGIKF